MPSPFFVSLLLPQHIALHNIASVSQQHCFVELYPTGNSVTGICPACIFTRVVCMHAYILPGTVRRVLTGGSGYQSLYCPPHEVTSSPFTGVSDADWYDWTIVTVYVVVRNLAARFFM